MASRLDRPWADACAALSAADPAFAAAMATLGPCTLVARRVPGGAFGALARAICYQQLAGAAAGAIHGRFAALYAGRPSPALVAATPEADLRAVGLSGAKVASLKDLAAKTLDGTVRLTGWNRLSDEEVVERLCTVRGIGPWTAQMFLMFHLLRDDVWPVGDLGVRTGFARIQGLASITPAELAVAGDRFRPFRTVAAWYCWRAVDAPPSTGPNTAGLNEARGGRSRGGRRTPCAWPTGPGWRSHPRPGS